MIISGGMLIKRLVGALQPQALLYRGSGGLPARVALTFDDGPHPDNTPRILDVLGRYGAQATFFVLGSEAARHPELVRRIHQAGHQVANHGYEHTSAKERPPSFLASNALRCQSLLEQQLGHALPREFRPPYGDITARSYLAVRQLGFRFAFWSVDSRDSFTTECAAVVSTLSNAGLNGGDIVLMHDDYAHTTEALPAILEHLRQRELATVRTCDF